MEAFTESYRGWCKRKNYKFRTDTAHKIYLLAQEGVATLPKCESTKMLITQACKSLNAVCEAKQSTQLEMQRLAAMLPEYEVVMQMEGAGPITGPALMAEIGDVRRFKNKKALVLLVLIFHTKLVNRGLEVVIREELNNDQWKRYEIFQDTLGGRPYLFNGGLPPGGSDGSGTPGIDYTVPAEALTDEEFAAIYKEAQKYVGTPYVWGGSTPETGFDCSGYVCWVYNQNGYDVGRTTANGLWNKSQHISEAEAKPGDLVFFKGTYDTPGMSHTGIYLGNGMMVSAGDPIKYANIHSSYWEKHLAGFGRLSK